MVLFQEKLIGEQDFRVRFDAIVKELIIPRQEARATGIIQPQFEPMGVRRKDFYNLEATQKLLEPKFRASMGHRPDGLIFQPLNFVIFKLKKLIIFLRKYKYGSVLKFDPEIEYPLDIIDIIKSIAICHIETYSS